MNMVEKVARALDLYLQPTRNLDIRHAAAKVAIAAMREPSEEMKRAGFTLCVNTDNMDEIYQAMIDAALKE